MIAFTLQMAEHVFKTARFFKDYDCEVCGAAWAARLLVEVIEVREVRSMRGVSGKTERVVQRDIFMCERCAHESMYKVVGDFRYTRMGESARAAWSPDKLEYRVARI